MKHNVHMPRPNSEGEQRDWLLMNAEEAAKLPWIKRSLRLTMLKNQYRTMSRYPFVARLSKEVADQLIDVARSDASRRPPFGMTLRFGMLLFTLAWLMVVGGLVLLFQVDGDNASAWGFTLLILGLTCNVLFHLWMGIYIFSFNRQMKASLRTASTREGRYYFCLKCQYDLRGSTSNTCPECGAPTRVDNISEAHA